MIRKASIKDMSSLLTISHRSFETPWSAASFEAEFHKYFSTTYLYVHNDASVAYLIVWIIQQEGEIVSLAVEPGWRNQGIAKKLMDHAIKTYHYVQEWSLEVNPCNFSATNLYRKYKFIKKRTIKNYYGQGKDAILMIRKQT